MSEGQYDILRRIQTKRKFGYDTDGEYSNDRTFAANVKSINKAESRRAFPETKEATKRAGGRALKFVTGFAREGYKSYQDVQRNRARKPMKYRGNVRATTQGLQRAIGSGSDISLSGAVAANDWAGERDIGNTIFFGNQNINKDILGPSFRAPELLPSRKKDTGEQEDLI